MPKLSDGKTGTALRQAGLLLLAAGVMALVSALWHGPVSLAPQRDEMTLTEALRRQPPPLWIDARPSAAYAASHLPGALSLNVEHWPELLPPVLEAWEPDRVAVVYGDSLGLQDSREVAERLRDFKLGPVWVLHGGWNAWKSK